MLRQRRPVARSARHLHRRGTSRLRPFSSAPPRASSRERISEPPKPSENLTGGRFLVVVLSGPTFALEVATGSPDAVVAASEDRRR